VKEYIEKPFVSIIMPTYNRVDYLGQAINSVKSQSYENWELIVVDDCSDDGTWQALESHSYSDSRIRCYKTNGQSGSPVAPRNIAFDYSNAKLGDLVAFLDSDDYWYKWKLENQVKAMLDGSLLNAISYHDMMMLYESKFSSEESRKEQWSRTASPYSGDCFSRLLRKNFIPTSSVLVRYTILKKYWPMDGSLSINHDWDLWLKIAHEHEVQYVNEVLGCLTIPYGDSVVKNRHMRRTECRTVVRRWKPHVDSVWYRRILLYYYLMEVIDSLPNWAQKTIRKWWYAQDRYK
jgi:glycosyltransferase involved in cell wall biosynthesis